MTIGRMIELHEQAGIDFDVNDGNVSLKARIAYSGKSVAHMAKKVGVSRATMYAIMADPKNATCRQAAIIADEAQLNAKERKVYFGL